MTRRLQLGKAVVVLLAALALVGMGWVVVARASDSRAVVGFTEAKSDMFVAAFIQRHGAALDAIYLANQGFSGTARARQGQSSAELVAFARSDAVTTFTNMFVGNRPRIQNFVDRYSESELLADQGLATQARSLLNLRSQIQAALGTARNGAPLIYAIEVRNASPEMLNAMRSDSAVGSIQSSATSSAARVKPAALDVPYHDPEAESRDVHATREAMLEILGR